MTRTKMTLGDLTETVAGAVGRGRGEDLSDIRTIVEIALKDDPHATVADIVSICETAAADWARDRDEA